MMRDDFEFSVPPSEVKERFVTPIEPRVDTERGKIIIGDYVIDFDQQIHEVNVSAEIYSNHSGEPAKAYLIDATAKELAQTMSWNWKIHKIDGRGNGENL